MIDDSQPNLPDVFADVEAEAAFEREGRPGRVGPRQRTVVRTAACRRVADAHVGFTGSPSS